MTTNVFQPLTNKNVESLIGKTIEWQAEAYSANDEYKGIAIITSVDLSEYRGLMCDVIEGENLCLAFLDCYGLKEVGHDTYRISDDNRVYCYSDSFREVFFKEI